MEWKCFLILFLTGLGMINSSGTSAHVMICFFYFRVQPKRKSTLNRVIFKPKSPAHNF